MPRQPMQAAFLVHILGVMLVIIPQPVAATAIAIAAVPAIKPFPAPLAARSTVDPNHHTPAMETAR